MPTRGMTLEQALARIETLARLVRESTLRRRGRNGPQPEQIPPTSSWSLVVDGSVIAATIFSLGSSTQGLPAFSPGWKKNDEHWFLSKGVDLNALLGQASKVELKLDLDCTGVDPCQGMIDQANAVLQSGAAFQLYALSELDPTDWVAGGPSSMGSTFKSYYFVSPTGGATAPRLLFDVPAQDGAVMARVTWVTKTRFATISGGFIADAKPVPTTWPSTWWHYGSTHVAAAKKRTPKRDAPKRNAPKRPRA